jgi:hypothetical protein
MLRSVRAWIDTRPRLRSFYRFSVGGLGGTIAAGSLERLRARFWVWWKGHASTGSVTATPHFDKRSDRNQALLGSPAGKSSVYSDHFAASSL